MRTFRTTITILANTEKLWNILTDAPTWTQWNSTVEKIEGRIALGETVKVYARISPGRAFPVKVKEFEPGKRMLWQGGMPLGLFTGRRTYSLNPLSDKTIFTMEEIFSGLMEPLISKSIPDMQPVFEQFAKDLKTYAEGKT